MDYEKKYKVALERANIIYTGKYNSETTAWTKEVLEAIFPELRESEDEMIRKTLITYMKSVIDINGIKGETIIAWLEKQKPVETKPHRPNGAIPYDRAFEEAQEYLSKRGFDIPWNDCDVFVDERYITQTVANVLTWADEHPKQNSIKWSEEDEIMYNHCIIDVYVTDSMKRWIKSLKQRMEEQQ